MLEMREAKLAYQKFVVAHDLTISLPEGRITAIVGPNGSGKSTVLRALARILKPAGGEVLLDGLEIGHWHTNQVARRLAMLPQAPTAPDGLTVWDLVAFGRFPYRGWFGGDRDSDAASIHKALEDVNLADLADRPVHSLSGGQRQRVWIAMALAQETQYLLLDEPTTYMDLAHQLELMDLIGRLNRDKGKTVVLVLHDLNLAARYAHHIIVMDWGAVAAEGTPADVLTPGVLREVFRIDARVFRDGPTGAIMCVPISAVAENRSGGPPN
jgi:iron complex transport system ATP-binding protein